MAQAQITNCACGETFNSLRSLRQHQRHCENPAMVVVEHDLPHLCTTCNRRFKRKCNLTQHRARCGPPADNEFSCPWCPQSFDNLAGLRLHQRRIHPLQYNQMDETVAERAPTTTFSNIELRDMAQEEATYQGSNINQHLARTFKKKLEATKYQRRKAPYKLMVENFKTDLAEGAVEGLPLPATQEDNLEPNDALPTPPSRQSFQRRSSSPIFVRETPTPPPNAERETTEAFRLFILSFLDNESISATERELINAVLEENPSLPGRIEDLVHHHNNSQPPPRHQQYSQRRPRQRNKRYVGNAATRGYAYKTNQILFHKNRRRLAETILADPQEEDRNVVHPPLEEITETYCERFGGLPAEDSHPIDNYPVMEEDEGIKLFSPISIEEITAALSGTRSTAAGPDGINITLLRRIPLQSIHLLLNVVYFTGYTPATWKSCRTILLPKGGDRLDVNNWRPITISSIWSRILNKILAARLGHLPMCQLQGGFRNFDGCMANAITLQAIMKTARYTIAPHTILTLDLAKAFDTVRHDSIKRALIRSQIHPRAIKYIMDTYTGATTTIKVANESTEPIHITKGVRQGDPLSPILFNLIMDELLVDLQSQPAGLPVNTDDPDYRVPALAYADDLLLLGQTPGEVDRLLQRTKTFLDNRGLKINPRKSTALTAMVVPQKKRLYIVTTSKFFVEGEAVRQIGPVDHYKYLGHAYGAFGIIPADIADLKIMLERLQKAALQPLQKLTLLKQFVIPKILYKIQAVNIFKTTLDTIDHLIRAAVKRFLRLPHSTANGMLYASIRNGGLGLQKLADTIPVSLIDRAHNIFLAPDSAARRALHSPWCVKQLQRLADISKHGLTKGDIARFWLQELQNSPSGNGLHQGCTGTVSGSWINNPPKYWNSRDQIRAIQLRANMLPTVGTVYQRGDAAKCRAGCQRNETLCHVLQACPTTHWLRCRRHDYAVNSLATALSKKGLTVIKEPNIWTAEGERRKPDIVVIEEDAITISDVQIVWEGPRPLASSYLSKVEYYGTPGFIEGIRRKWPGRRISVLPTIIGARGVWSDLNSQLFTKFNLPASLAQQLVLGVIKGSCQIHTDFSRLVWRTRA